MRKIYFRNKHYEEYMENTLINQLGVISEENDKTSKSILPESSKSTFECDLAESYIGSYQNILFWFNNYKFLKLYDSTIYEYGLMSDNGLELLYIIKNDTSENLRIKARF